MNSQPLIFDYINENKIDKMKNKFQKTSYMQTALQYFTCYYLSYFIYKQQNRRILIFEENSSTYTMHNSYLASSLQEELQAIQNERIQRDNKIMAKFEARKNQIIQSACTEISPYYQEKRKFNRVQKNDDQSKLQMVGNFLKQALAQTEQSIIRTISKERLAQAEQIKKQLNSIKQEIVHLKENKEPQFQFEARPQLQPQQQILLNTANSYCKSSNSSQAPSSKSQPSNPNTNQNRPNMRLFQAILELGNQNKLKPNQMMNLFTNIFSEPNSSNSGQLQKQQLNSVKKEKRSSSKASIKDKQNVEPKLKKKKSSSIAKLENNHDDSVVGEVLTQLTKPKKKRESEKDQNKQQNRKSVRKSSKLEKKEKPVKQQSIPKQQTKKRKKSEVNLPKPESESKPKKRSSKIDISIDIEAKGEAKPKKKPVSKIDIQPVTKPRKQSKNKIDVPESKMKSSKKKINEAENRVKQSKKKIDETQIHNTKPSKGKKSKIEQSQQRQKQSKKKIDDSQTQVKPSKKNIQKKQSKKQIEKPRLPASQLIDNSALRQISKKLAKRESISKKQQKQATSKSKKDSDKPKPSARPQSSNKIRNSVSKK